MYRYSCDEGMTWRNYNFLDENIVVWGIVTEPGEATTQLMLVTYIHPTCVPLPMVITCIGCLVHIHSLQVHTGRSSISILLLSFPSRVEHQIMKTGPCQMG